MDPIEVEKAQRIYYQSIVYWVCRELERAFGKRTSKGDGVVCGTVYSPSNQVQQLMTELADSRVAWAEDQAAKQTPVTPYLSPPAAGPGLDAEATGIVRRLVKWNEDFPKGMIHPFRAEKVLDEIIADAKAAELRSALGAGEDDGNLPVTEEWLSATFGPHLAMCDWKRPALHFATDKFARVLGWCMPCGSLDPCVCLDQVVIIERPTRGQIRHLIAALGIPLPPDPAPNEGGVK